MYEVAWHALAAAIALAPVIAALLALRWLMDLRSQGKEQIRLIEEQNELLRSLAGACGSTTGSEDERHQNHR
ncbi:hypothetical protein [Gordonibacter pamelaeae]